VSALSTELFGAACVAAERLILDTIYPFFSASAVCAFGHMITRLYLSLLLTPSSLLVCSVISRLILHKLPHVAIHRTRRQYVHCIPVRFKVFHRHLHSVLKDFMCISKDLYLQRQIKLEHIEHSDSISHCANHMVPQESARQ
jgi:hypothetical protein